MIVLANPRNRQTTIQPVPVFLIAAVSRNGVIGRADGSLPWTAPADLRHFKLTTQNCVLLAGRRTADKLPALPGRDLIVLSRVAHSGDHYANSPADALRKAQQLAKDNHRTAIAVIGGGEIYRAFLPFISESYISSIDADIAGSATFPVAEHDALPWRSRSTIGNFEAEVDHKLVHGRFQHLTL